MTTETTTKPPVDPTTTPPDDQAPVDATRSGDELLLGPDSDATPMLSMVMPTLNEEAGIAECIERVKRALEELQITGEVVVSDSSDDRTPEIARELGAVVVTPDEPGYGYAYRYAFARTRGAYIAMGDADTTYDFEELPKLYDHVAHGEADVAMGSRLEGEIKDGAMPPLHQYVGNPLLTRFLNAFYDAGISDAHSGMRVFSRQALAEMDLSTDGMEFASEMVMEAGARDLEIVEEPITYHEREGEATLDSFQDGWRHVRFMLVNAPGYLFALPGIAMTLVGALICTLSMFQVGIGGTSFGVHSMLFGSLGTLVGMQVVSLGVFTTVAADPIRSPDDPITNAIVDHVTLERGIAVGAVIFAVGFGFGVSLLWQWAASGFTRLPFVMGDVLVLTAMVLGLQIAFSSFCLSAVADRA